MAGPNVVTEEQAKTMWCPDSRVLAADSAGNVREGAPTAYNRGMGTPNQLPVDYEEAAAKAMKTAAELLQRLAAPVTEGEVKGVVRSLSLIACAPRCEHASECNCTVLDNAADLIQRLAAPVTEGEVGEVVKRLRELSKAMLSADMDMRLPAGSIDPDEIATTSAS